MTDLLAAGRFAGHVADARALPNMRFVETTYRAGQVLRPHAHEHAHICLVLDGCYTESLEQSNARRGPLAVTFLPEQCAHGETHHTAGRHFIIEFEQSGCDLFGETERPQHAVALEGRAALHAAQLYWEFRSVRGLGADSADLVCELLATCSRAPAAGHARWLARTRDSVRDRYTTALSLRLLAEEAGVHPVHLAQSFRRVYGETVGNFIRQLRVQHACHALLVGSAPLSQIAAAAGFADQSHLTRCFRRAMGVTPGSYRRIVGTRSQA
jgi:AraC family transcriptional regulator